MYSVLKATVLIPRTSVVRTATIYCRSKAQIAAGSVQEFAQLLQEETGRTRVGNNHLKKVVNTTRTTEELEELADLISIFRSRNKPINRSVASKIVNQYVEHGEAAFVARMTRNKAKYGLYPETAAYSALLDALVEAERNKAYISVFERMLLDNDDAVPSEEVMNNLVAAACAASCPAHRSKVSEYCSAATEDNILGDATLKQITDLAEECVVNAEFAAAEHCLKCNMPAETKRQLQLRVAVGKGKAGAVLAVLQEHATAAFPAELLTEVLAMPDQGKLGMSISAAVANICAAQGITLPSVDSPSDEPDNAEDGADDVGTDDGDTPAPETGDTSENDAPLTDADLFK